MKLEGSLPRSQDTATFTYHEPAQSIPRLPKLFL
jgi:hypothetical protein